MHPQLADQVFLLLLVHDAHACSSVIQTSMRLITRPPGCRGVPQKCGPDSKAACAVSGRRRLVTFDPCQERELQRLMDMQVAEINRATKDALTNRQARLHFSVFERHRERERETESEG